MDENLLFEWDDQKSDRNFRDKVLTFLSPRKSFAMRFLKKKTLVRIMER